MASIRPVLLAVSLAVAGGLVAAGCGNDSGVSSDTTTTTTTTAPTTTVSSGKDEVCAARSTLVTSLAGIKDIDISKGLDGVKATFETIRTDAQAFADAAKVDYATESDALKASVNELSDALGKLGSSSGVAAALASLGSAGAKVATSAQDLITKVAADCPN